MQKHKKAGSFVKIIVWIPMFLVGIFLLLTDGACSGGKFCTKMPGVIAFLGAALVATSVSIFALSSEKSVYKRIGITLVVALVLYGLRLLGYFLA